MSRRTRRHPEPSLKRLLERRELLKVMMQMPSLAGHRKVTQMSLAALETKIRAKLQAEPGCWMVKPAAANLDAEQPEQSDPDVTCFQTLGNRPSWLKSSQF